MVYSPFTSCMITLMLIYVKQEQHCGELCWPDHTFILFDKQRTRVCMSENPAMTRDCRTNTCGFPWPAVKTRSKSRHCILKQSSVHRVRLESPLTISDGDETICCGNIILFVVRMVIECEKRCFLPMGSNDTFRQ